MIQRAFSLDNGITNLGLTPIYCIIFLFLKERDAVRIMNMKYVVGEGFGIVPAFMNTSVQRSK